MSIKTHLEVSKTDLPRISQRTQSKIAHLTVMVGAVVSVLLIMSILFLELSRGTIGLLVVITIIFMIITGLHIAAAIIVGSSTGLLAIGGSGALWNSIQELTYNSVASWQYSVIPVFILMGIALWRSGISARAFATARLWFGGLPGGLAVGTTVTGASLAAASGNTIGIAYAVGRAAIPEMIKANYKPSLAMGAVSMTGILGQIIPPSILLVIYAGMVQTPVGPQLMAGVIPGLVLTIAFSLMIVIRSTLSPGLAPRLAQTDVSWAVRFKALYGILPIVLVIGVIIGGILSGLFTATEAGAVGAFLAILLGLVALPRQSWKKNSESFLKETVLTTVYSTSAVFLLLIAVHFLTLVMTLSRVANDLAGGLIGLGLTPTSFLLVLIPFYLLLGMFMDTLSMLLITVPVLLPTLIAFDINLIWFGVFVVIVAELALVTPPLGMLIFIVHNLTKDNNVNLGRKITVVDGFKGSSWFVLVTVGILLIMVFFPQIATWLPSIQDK